MAIRRSVSLWTVVWLTAYALPLLGTTAPSLGTDWIIAADKALKSVVPIAIQVDEDARACTGFIINTSGPEDTDRVLTAAHCDGTMYVDGVSPKILYKDAKVDLMVLSVPDTGRPALRIAGHDPKVMEDVLSLGYGGGLDKPLVRLAHVSAVNVPLPGFSGQYMLTDAPFVAGMSGGPVLGATGEVTMIVQLGDARVGAGRGAELIRDKVGRYAEAPATASPHKN